MTAKRFTIEILDENNWLIEDNETGLDYNPIDGTTRVLKGLVDLVNNFHEENKQLKKELKEFKDYVFSDEKILCYSCVNCISKGIYEVECSEKGKVDVHGICFLYWKKELKE